MDKVCQKKTSGASSALLMSPLSMENLPLAIQIGLEAMDCDLNTKYSFDDICKKVTAAMKTHSCEAAEIGMAGMLLYFQSQCMTCMGGNQLQHLLSLLANEIEILKS